MVSYSSEKKSTENSYERVYFYDVSFHNCHKVQYKFKILLNTMFYLTSMGGEGVREHLKGCFKSLSAFFWKKQGIN